MLTLIFFILHLKLRRIVAAVVLTAFVTTSVMGATGLACAQALLPLPAPGVRVDLSPAFKPALLTGMKVYPDTPFRFDFILDKGDMGHGVETQNFASLREDSTRLIKYFLAALTVPEKDLWVNLSPYEKDRIVPEAFGRTAMGRDLLAEDYLLKQITASLIYPEGDTGKTFWKRVYAEAFAKFGTTDIPVDTFNKVWIIPDKAVVYENAGTATAYVAETHLKVMLESDYVAMSHQKDMAESPAPVGDTAYTRADIKSAATTEAGSSMGVGADLVSARNESTKNILREVVIPVLEKEVNEGQNFTQLRQVFHSLILAAWYKKKIKDSILSQVYADQNKVAGVDVPDPQEASRIYSRYLEAFKTGVYNYIKEEQDPATQEMIPRKYFSGGVIGDTSKMEVVPVPVDFAEKPGNKLKLTVDLAEESSNEAVIKRMLAKKRLNVALIWDELLKAKYIDFKGNILPKFHELNQYSEIVFTPEMSDYVKEAVYTVLKNPQLIVAKKEQFGLIQVKQNMKKIVKENANRWRSEIKSAALIKKVFPGRDERRSPGVNAVTIDVLPALNLLFRS